MKARSKQRAVKVVNFLPAGGICTTVKPWLLPANKLEKAVNVMLVGSLNEREQLVIKGRSRPGTRRLTSQALPNAEQVRAHLRLNGTDYLASDANLYRAAANGAPQLIGAVAAAPSLVEYLGYCVVLDGETAKTVDPADGHAYNALWDTAGLMHSALDDAEAGSISLYSGGVTRAGIKLTLPDWGPGELPVNLLKVVITKLGSPTGNVTAKVFSADGATLLATGDSLDSAELPSDPAANVHQTLDFGSPTSQAAAATVILCIEYSGGDSSNCVRLHYATASGGHAITYNGSWSSVDAAKEPLMGVGPGLAPAALVGTVKNERLFMGGGGATAEEKSRLHYCNILDPYNWGGLLYQGGSAGWIGVARHDGGEINGLARYFEDLYINKGGNNRSLHALSGSIPGESGDLKVFPVFSNEGAAAGRTLVEVGNNLLFMDLAAVLAVEAIPGGGFGNVRKYPRHLDIADILEAHADDEAFAAYDRARDQYWLQLNGLDYTLIYHDLAKAWTTYEWAGLTPTCFNHQDGQTFIGAGGHLHVMDEAVANHDGYYSGADTGQAFASTLWGPMLDLGAAYLDKEFKWLAYQLSARLGASGAIAFEIRNDQGQNASLSLEHEFLLPLDDDVVIRELSALSVGDGAYPVGGGGNVLMAHPINFNANYCQVRLSLNPGGAPVYLGPINLTVALLGRS